MSASSPTWICIPELKSYYRILSSDKQSITLWQVAGHLPVAITAWQKGDSTIQKISVQVLGLKAFDGISITSPGVAEMKFVLYGLDSGILAKPINGSQLDAAISTLKEATET